MKISIDIVHTTHFPECMSLQDIQQATLLDDKPTTLKGLDNRNLAVKQKWYSTEAQTILDLQR